MTTLRTVLITGGSKGIGFGLAARFRARGDRVLVTGRSATSLLRVEQQLPGIETMVSDIGSSDDRERLARFVSDTVPTLDLVINNAGIQRRVALAHDQAPWPERQQEIDVLLGGPVHLNHLLVPIMLGHGRPATIVNVTSGGALVPQPFAPVYSAAKAAVHSYTASLRHALAGTPVGVCELIPPAVATDLAGSDRPHGAPIAEFCDAAFEAIVSGVDVFGYGPTDAPAVRARLAVERAMFDAGAGRFPVSTYGRGAGDPGRRGPQQRQRHD